MNSTLICTKDTVLTKVQGSDQPRGIHRNIFISNTFTSLFQLAELTRQRDDTELLIPSYKVNPNQLLSYFFTSILSEGYHMMNPNDVKAYMKNEKFGTIITQVSKFMVGNMGQKSISHKSKSVPFLGMHCI